MIARRRLLLTLLAACALLVCGGCVSLEPSRITYSIERDDADADRRQRTVTSKIGVQVTYDLHP